MPDPRPARRVGGRARLFTIPQSAPFLDSLARAVLAGNLPVPGGDAPDLLELTRTTVLLPTRRACRGLRDAFLRVSGGRAALLPRIRPIGDVEEETSLIRGSGDLGGEGELALAQPAAIGNLERRLVLTRLILAWRDATDSGCHAADATGEAAFPAATPAQASILAARLAELMDSLESEQVDLASVGDLVPERFAEHWRLTVDFLKIVTEHWPRHLEERGLTTAFRCRNVLMAAETERLAVSPPDAPVIAAGSTGSIPATAALLSVIAGLPLGAVVLPGLDLHLDDESWSAIADDHPEHPQAGMRQLIDRMGADRRDVVMLPDAEPDDAGRARLELISETMRPAGTTERWQRFAETDARGAVAESCRGIDVLEAPSARDEVEAVALILRGVAEQPGKQAALVTPDRTLARRVATRLQEWDLDVDDSAGVPLAETPPGAFLDLIVDVAHARFAPVPLLALLKHPLCRLGRSAGAIRRASRLVELAAFRRPAAAAGVDEALRAVHRTRSHVREGGRVHPALTRFGPQDWQAAETVLADLKDTCAPLARLYEQAGTTPLRDFVDAHVAVAEALARDEAGDHQALWHGDAGEALAILLAEMLSVDESGPALSAADYAEFFRSLFAGQVVRPRAPAHPRIHIWGPLEARLQQPDLVILGGLNEGTWPTPREPDPWLSRPMRAEIGLPSPERRIGLAAHDFAQLLGTPEIVLTRATRVAGVPTVPSRWLLRLQAVGGLLGSVAFSDAAAPWLDWVRRRESVAAHAPRACPEPRPPLAARPRKLSVTRIEDWIANPYAIYAREILRLVPLEDIAPEPDPALRGNIVHRVLHRFTELHGVALPQDAATELVALARELMRDYEGFARIAAFWWPQFARFADWFADTEPARRAGVAQVHAEVRGSLDLNMPAGNFRLTARADRIDVRESGELVIYDYKTGAPPPARQVSELFAPQLPLEAAIAAAGGFAGVAGASVAELRYVRVSGREPAGEVRSASPEPAGALAGSALEELRTLVTAFDDPATAYVPLRRPRLENKYRYDDYAHLARVQEWSSGDLADG